MTTLLSVRQGTFAGGEVRVGGGEGGEVVGAQDVSGGAVQGAKIERPGTGPDVRGEGWRADVALAVLRWPFAVGRGAQREDPVLVGFAEGAVARVEARGNELGAEDA